jgi:hypothetical protein
MSLRDGSDILPRINARLYGFCAPMSRPQIASVLLG